MHKYENLKVWQRAIDLAVRIYQVSANLPPDERYGLISQMRRSATSIPLNIAEGSGNSSNKEFCRFLEIALRSGYEVLTTIEISRWLTYITDEVSLELQTETREIIAMIVGLTKTLGKS